MLKKTLTILTVIVGICAGATVSAASSTTTATPKKPKNIFTGSWKANDGTMLISFFGTDSLKVTDSKGQKKSESVGTFVKNDTTFTATLLNSELTLNMVFRFKVKDKKTVTAMITEFSVDGEKTDAPKKWMTMTRIPAPAPKTTSPTPTPTPAK